MDRFQEMLEMQLALQNRFMKDKPQTLTGDAMADFMRWNAFALDDEIHEAMQEVDWKPWAHKDPRTIREEAFLGEMVDAYHFFMNMLLCALPDSPEVIAEKFFARYTKKNQINAQRQEEGYDGITGKCPKCHRDLKEVGLLHACDVE
jgi:dimeric dUTPase (all-alpha-NTP-PPase superfamily)